MVEPLIVNENREIIDGTRRWLATLELEKDSVEVVEKSYSSVEEEEKAILHHNDDRDETFSQKIRVALEYERLVAPLLEKRMKAGKSLEEQEDHPLLKSKEGKTALELAADRVGWGQTKFYEAKTVWEAKESGDNYARTLVTQLDADDTTVHAAYQELKEHEEETSRDEDYIVRGLSDQDVYAEEKIEAYGPIQASFRTEPHRFKNILSKSSPFRSLDGASSAADEDPDVYIEIRESEVRMLTAEQPGMIHSHHFFSEDYFEEIALESDGPVGIAIPIDLAERL
jgi:ParB-like chromosome segregation protein Spo0J